MRVFAAILYNIKTSTCQLLSFHLIVLIAWNYLTLSLSIYLSLSLSLSLCIYLRPSPFSLACRVK